MYVGIQTEHSCSNKQLNQLLYPQNRTFIFGGIKRSYSTSGCVFCYTQPDGVLLKLKHVYVALFDVYCSRFVVLLFIIQWYESP